MKKRFMFALLAVVLLASGCDSASPGYERAAERAEEYAKAVNYEYETPEVIYSLLCKDYRESVAEADFCEAYAKERSFPYITPLYVFDPEITLSEDDLEARVVYKQAARIIGMEYEIAMVFEDGDYYIKDWEELLDGSYLEKFENIPYSLDWYYNPEDIE